MNYTPELNLLGVPLRQLPCLPGKGAPTTATEGEVGELYMDTDTGAVYKCTAVTGGAYTWVPNDIYTDISNGIPNAIRVLVGNQFYIYFRNVLSRPDTHFWCNKVNGLETKLYNDYLVITATEAGSKTLSWKVYDNLLNVLDSGELTVIASADKAINCTALVLGDSTVTQYSGISQKLLDCTSAGGGTLTLLGTRGTAPALHEGRAGWAASTYCNYAEASSLVNPFYNNGFDFSYYMEQQGYSGVDVVVVQLGINDIFGMTLENFTPNATLGYLQTIVDSILDYDSDIKVIVNLITPPNGNNHSFTEAYGTQQVEFAYRTNTIRMSQAMIEHFANNESVTLCANNCVLDDTTDIYDGVHPTQDGYAVLGQNIYETIINVCEADLLRLHKRTAVFRESTAVKPGIEATVAKEMAFDKMYYFDARNGVSIGTGNSSVSLNDLDATKNSLKFTSATTGTTSHLSAFGIAVPLDLEDGKTYAVSADMPSSDNDLYLQTYTKDGDMWTFESWVEVPWVTGNTSRMTFTTEAGKGYALLFAHKTAKVNSLSEFNEISVVEV